MRGHRVVLAVVCCCGLSAACAPAGLAKSPTPRRVAHHRHAVRRAAHRTTGKSKTAVWTLTEYSKGNLHKLKTGSPYYGLVYRYGVALVSHKENIGYKWNEERQFACELGSWSGTVKSNSVASPEIALETMEAARCPEQVRPHDEVRETFTPWTSSNVKFSLLPAVLTLESGGARLAPGSDFEVEVDDLLGGEKRCKYFSLNTMSGTVTPGAPAEAQQLAFNFSAKFAPEQFTGSCPEEATVFLLVRSYVGQYGPAMFAEHA
jgi:hypothetical protein